MVVSYAQRSLYVLVLCVIFSGCVGMGEYEDRLVEINQMKRKIRASNQALSKVEAEKQKLAKENESLRRENKKLKAEITKLKLAIKNAKKNFDNFFKQKMFSQLSQLEKDFQINPDTGGIVLQGDVFFNSGSARLKRSGKKFLAGLARKLSAPAYRGYNIVVAGHTDSDPVRAGRYSKYSDNWILSCARAHSVLKYLISRGISPKRLHIAGYGASQPRASNKTRKGKKLNRRVEILLRKPLHLSKNMRG
ncbi:MAG: hypothetical protein D6805_05715 [Planctomycetota bacterium]|nr:MAG: hypothetical protein D6805_05715 [Planctomycetota bacterium]